MSTTARPLTATAQPNQSVRNAFEALEALAFAAAPQSTGEIATRLGIGKPVASRLLLTLLELGYVSRVGRGVWRVSAGLMALGALGLRNSPLGRGREPLEELAAKLRCTVAAGFVWKRQVVYLFTTAGDGAVRGLGAPWPVEESSIGQLLTSRSEPASKLVWRKERSEFSLAVPFGFDGQRYGLAVAGPAALYRAGETEALLHGVAKQVEELERTP
jgi:DNA-binding IclR family transcriptional regulator